MGGGDCFFKEPMALLFNGCTVVNASSPSSASEFSSNWQINSKQKYKWEENVRHDKASKSKGCYEKKILLHQNSRWLRFLRGAMRGAFTHNMYSSSKYYKKTKQNVTSHEYKIEKIQLPKPIIRAVNIFLKTLLTKIHFAKICEKFCMYYLYFMLEHVTVT